jgi:hypothetical protein
LRKCRFRGKLRRDKDFRGFSSDLLLCFPSWTSWVRIPSPALNPSKTSTYNHTPDFRSTLEARTNEDNWSL